MLTFSQFIPLLLLSPWTGRAADRRDRRQIVLVAQAASTVLGGGLAALAWTGEATAGAVIAFSAALGVANAFVAPAAQALLGSLVEREELASAVALNSMTYNIARAVGPALAALVVETLGIPAAFAINALSYVGLAVGVALVRPRPAARPASPRLGDGIRLLRRDPHLVGLLVVVMLVGFASDPINTLAPAFAETFGRPDTDAGFVVGIFGLGAVTAAVVVAGRVAGSRRRLALTLALLGLGVAAFSVTPWLPLAFAFLFVGGFGYLASNTSATSRLLLGVDESERGRSMALWTVAFLGLRPVSSLVDGAIADAFGVRAAGVALAVPALLAAVAVAFSVGRRSTWAPQPPRGQPSRLR